MIEMTEQEFQIISAYIRTQYGVNLEKKKYLIESKLWIELARVKVQSYGEYWRVLQKDTTGIMKQRMMDLLTTNYTYFCREEKHFEFIYNRILPELEKKKVPRFRIWCAGCASGQECYTLAMSLMEAQENRNLKIPFEILGTDLSEKVIKEARRGAYGSSDYGRLPQSWKNKYCEPFSQGEFKVKASVKNYVKFQRHNLMTSLGALGCFELVFCRNVLIYFRDVERNQLLRHIREALAPEGYLFIGHTETLMNSLVPFTYLQPAVYQKER